MSIEGNWLQRRDLTEILLIIIGSALFIMTIYMIHQVQIWQAEHIADKAHIDSLDCKSLGKWIIDNAESRTDSEDYVDSNFHYAQAKYLVCTHGGLSP